MKQNVNPNAYFWQEKHVRLRPMVQEDWKIWHEDATDSDGMRLLNWGVELPMTEAMAQDKVETWVGFGNDDRYMFTIESLSGEVVGGINIDSVDNKNGTFSFGIRIYRAFRNKGYAEEALRIILRYAFYEMRLQKCNSGCVHINTGSIRLHGKVGFIQEGLRRRQNYTNGRYYDNILFGLTREEFDENERHYRR